MKYQLLIFFPRLQREAEEVDRQLEAAQAETRRLQDLLESREQDVQRLREIVMQQRAVKAIRLAANEAKEAMKNISAEDNPQQKAEMQKQLDQLRCHELKTHLSSDITS